MYQIEVCSTLSRPWNKYEQVESMLRTEREDERECALHWALVVVWPKDGQDGVRRPSSEGIRHQMIMLVRSRTEHRTHILHTR